MKYIRVGVIVFFAFSLYNALSAKVLITDLKCEFRSKPEDIDSNRIRFSWMYEGNTPFSQAFYRIEIASDSKLLNAGKADLYSSDVINSTSGYTQTELPGLKNKTKYFWRITAWNSDKSIKLVSGISDFSTAIKSTDSWTAKWITDGFDRDYKPSPLLRKTFNTSQRPVKASLYVSAGGYYKFFVNGKRVGNAVLDQGYTHFDKRILYSVHDVTKLIDSGKNSLAAVLGNGWYNIQSLAVWNFDLASWRSRPRLLCELEIEYADGSHSTIVSDDTWRTSTGPYLFNNLYSGDVYDARLEKEGWQLADFNDSDWKNAKITISPAPIIESQSMPSITENEILIPKTIRSFGKNLYVIDFGKNSAGYCRFRLKAERGTKITLKYGEKTDSTGRLDQSPVSKYFHKEGPLVKRNADKPDIDPNEVFQMDTYIFRGDKNAEVYSPDFTYHGFQYVEIESSAPILLTKENITGIFVHTNLAPTGKFECSNPLINQLYRATMRSYLSNLHSIPTDCPQREKNGWTADAYISIDLALLNYDGILFYEKWMRDFIDNQNTEGRLSGIIPSAGWGYIDWVGPTWDLAMFAIPDALYRYYGQTKAIEQLYPAMEKYLKYLKSREVDGMITFGIGDWVPVDTKTPTDFTSMCSYFYMNKLMSDFATILKKDNFVYKNKAAVLKDIINTKFFNSQTVVYSNGSPTSLAYPLFLGLVPGNFENRIARNLNDLIVKNKYQIDFGMLGSKYVPRMLAKYGYGETVVKMLLNEKQPSWLGWIKDGLTTLPEWFQKNEYRNASLNHVFLGDISAWMTNYLAGIRQPDDTNGFQNIIISPLYTKSLNYAKAEYLSVNGKISSAWVRNGNQLSLKLTIPQNCNATVKTNKTLKLGPGAYKFEWIDN